MLELEEILIARPSFRRRRRHDYHLGVLLSKLWVPESQLRHMPPAERSGHPSEEGQDDVLATSELRERHVRALRARQPKIWSRFSWLQPPPLSRLYLYV